MLKLIFCGLILSTIHLFAGNKWEEDGVILGTPQEIECVDTLHIYSITTTGLPNRIYKSVDQGKSWELVQDNFPEIGNSKSMSVPDTNNIFITCQNYGNIFTSIDGGKTFNETILDSVHSFQSISMYDTNIGVLTNTYIIPNIYYILITHDGWKTFRKFNIEKQNRKYSYWTSSFLNDSILYSIVYESDISTNPNGVYIQTSMLKLNINTLEYELNPIDKDLALFDLCVVNEKLMFVCGRTNAMNGGSCNDAIYKSVNGGETWQRLLNLYYDNKLDNHSRVPFGLQSLSFRDSLTGIAVGQFGKIVYTYDGGESWIYEDSLHPDIINKTPATMIVRYAGSIPIIATYQGFMYRLLQDNLAPGPENKYRISGRVWEGNHGQPGIPIANGYQVTMTDSAGYYHFRKLAKGIYKIRPLNKYFDGPNHDIGYKPFTYHPDDYVIDLSSDTTGFDFNAEDLRVFRSVSGSVKNANDSGLADITVQIGDSVKTTDISGNYFFPKIESKRSFFVTPIDSEYQFMPKYYSINIVNDTTELNFIASPITDVKETFENDLLNLRAANDKLIVENQIPISGMTVIISDLLCMELLKQPLRNEIDISSLSRGIYFVSILKSNNIYRTYKIYVE